MKTAEYEISLQDGENIKIIPVETKNLDIRELVLLLEGECTADNSLVFYTGVDRDNNHDIDVSWESLLNIGWDNLEESFSNFSEPGHKRIAIEFYFKSVGKCYSGKLLDSNCKTEFENLERPDFELPKDFGVIILSGQGRTPAKGKAKI